MKEERQTLMSGPQQDELSSGLQQQDAIWPKNRQLPRINAIPSVSPQPLKQQLTLFLSVGQAPLPFLFLCCLSCPAHSFTVLTDCVPSVSLLFSARLASSCNPSVSCCLHLPPPTSLSLPSVAAQSVNAQSTLYDWYECV